MKQGKNITELAQELDRQVKSRKDFIATTDALAMRHEKEQGEVGFEYGKLVLDGLNGSGKSVNDFAHGQFSSELGIPKKYYDRMKTEAPNLLVNNVNHWLHNEPKRRLVRTLDGRVRAFLSDKYRPLDNFDLASTILPVFADRGAQVESSELTETRLYLKATLPTMTATITGSRQKGDIVTAGLVVSNSEVGAGALRIEPMIYRLVCLNGMIAADSTLRKYHVGKAADGDGVFEYLSTETRQADDKAFWLKARDVVRAAFNEVVFNALVKKIEDATQERIGTKLETFVEDVTERFTLPEGTREGILRYLIEGGDLSRWGAVNALTAASQDVESYDLATEMERAGGKVLELAPSEWKDLAQVAA
jgi:hypothetical protein